jgi:hypothetical protein
MSQVLTQVRHFPREGVAPWDMGRIGRTYPREGTYIACEQRNVRAAYARFAGSSLRASDVLGILVRRCRTMWMWARRA